MFSLSCDAGEYRLLYLKRICEALACCMEAVIDDCIEHGKILNSAVSLLYYASVSCCQFSTGANIEIMFLMTDLSHWIRAWSSPVHWIIFMWANVSPNRTVFQDATRINNHPSPHVAVQLLLSLSLSLSGLWVMRHFLQPFELFFIVYNARLCEGH